MLKKWFVVVVLLVCSVGAVAEECTGAKGTYLTTKVDTSGVDKGSVGRTILSLSPGGFATMTDSAQYGFKGYQAFGMMQGSWSCLSESDENTTITVTLLDFSYPSAEDPDAKVALVEITGAINGKTGELQGTTKVKLYPISDDPFSDATPEVDVGYTFSGQRIPNTH
ncbi:MAG: hypothetical protein AAGF35_02185 [Pseudomonadota bacterium]